MSLQVATNLAALTDVLTWFDQFNHPPVPYSIWLSCQLVLAEAFTNAVRHAHVGKPTEVPIDIEVTVAANAIELKVWDRGVECNLNQVFSHTTLEMAPDAERGRGLKIMCKIADHLSYDRIGIRNCLHIVKNY